MNSRELKVKREKLKIEEKGDIVGVKAQTSGVIATAQFLSLSKTFKTRLFKCVRPLLIREGIGDRYKKVRRSSLTPITSKNPLPSTAKAESFLEKTKMDCGALCVCARRNDTTGNAKLKMQGVIAKTEKDETTAFARPFLKGVIKTSAIAQHFKLKNFRPNGRIEFLKCGWDRGGIKTAGEVGNSERNQCPARSSELKSPRPNGLQKFLNSAEPLKMQGDSGAVAHPLDSKSLLPFAQRSDSADRAGRLNKKEQNRQRLCPRFCDTLISKISARKTKKTATNAAPEIFEEVGGGGGERT